LENYFIESIQKTIPELQSKKIRQYVSDLGLSEYDASVITEEKEFSDYFEKVIENIDDHKMAANWMIGPIRSWMNENNKEITDFQLTPEKIAGLIELVKSGKTNFSVASTRLFTFLLLNPGKIPKEAAIELNLLQRSDVSFIEQFIDKVIKEYPEKVQEYKKGKKGLLGFFVGEIMKASEGKADPKITNELLMEKLKS
jgi:aspartyl-tRNA(Asn)/glutamyl-tRNA(Gln) amidotransferase subunit B